ncbi:hypothetical protein PR202_ga09839 [Eleusine coracana subsp. coracana]|uniref:Uncharacterized protein n=1 Tax=Eleusine coracana subsp. coracana TaxID=191504 RepID=A0AAV5C5K0_ELECO|nr:hypothetical protein PR202_ga09839 [Eleusine coracana subsp. coracana]
MARSPCCDKARVKRGPWSQEEDAILRSFVQRFGNAGNWIALPQKAGIATIIPLRTAWSVIASRLPGRTDNDVKNYWNTKLKKKFLAAAKREGTPSRLPPPPPPSSGDSIAAVDDEKQLQDDRAPPTSHSFANLDTATVEDVDDELLVKSEQLYSELMDLIEQQSTLSTKDGTSTMESCTPSSSSGTSPAVGSGSDSCHVCPMEEVQDTTLLSESISSSLFDAHGGIDAFDATDLMMPDYSFQNLLAMSYDEFATVNQELYF